MSEAGPSSTPHRAAFDDSDSSDAELEAAIRRTVSADLQLRFCPAEIAVFQLVT